MLRNLAVVAAILVCASAVTAQEAEWVVSYVDRATGIREESGGWRSQEAARAWFDFIQVPWLAGDGGPQYVGVRIYQRSAGGGVQLPQFVDFLLDASDRVGTAVDVVNENYESLRDRMFGAPGLQGYADSAARAYEHAAEAKKKLLNLTGEASEAVLMGVNDKIAEYNRTLEAAQSLPGGSSFSRLPKMTPVTSELIQKSQDFVAAATEQLDLRSEEQKLDDERTQLADERAVVLAETKAVRQLEQEVKRLRDRATEEMLVGRSASGRYQLGGSAGIEFSYHFDSGNSLSYRSPYESGSGSYSISGNTITMRIGATSQEGTISGNEITMRLRKDSGTTGSESSTVSGGNLDDAISAQTKAKTDELNQRKQALDADRSKYLQKKASYDQKAADYAKRHQKLKTVGQRLKELAYAPPRPAGQTPRTVLPSASGSAPATGRQTPRTTSP